MAERAKVWIGLIGWIGLLAVVGCDTQGPTENTPPQALLTNVPPAGDTLGAVLTLHWDGTDEDGYVTGYEYRYRTVAFTEDGDSTVFDWGPGQREGGWEATEETRLQIAFNSQGEINRQTFQVRAIDNNGVPSPVDERVLYTTRSIAPTAEVVSPASGELFLAREQQTDWWEGVPIAFTARDPNVDGEVVEYAWAVDDGPWHWTEDTTAILEPDVFARPLDGNHTLRIQARDNTNLISEPATVEFELVEASFEKDVLIVDETNEEAVPFSRAGFEASDEDVDQFYGDVFNTPNQEDWWDYEEQGVPPKSKLAQYQLVLWHADNDYANASNAHALPQHTDVISEYLDVGGNLIMSGWRMLASFAPETFSTSDQVEYTFPDTTFVRTYLHIKTAKQPARPAFLGGDFQGATGIGSFRTVMVDSTKLEGVSPYQGFPTQVNVVSEPPSFTEPIYRYISRNDRADFQDLPVAVRYYGTAFDAVVFGFPLYFLWKNDAEKLGKDVLSNLGLQ